jgi:hypothetical protein
MRRIEISELRELGSARPEAVLTAAGARPRGAMTDRLMIIAADHTARGVLSVGSRPMAMADRGDLLARLVAALERPGVDGVLGTADVLEDLLLLGALDEKVVFGSMNRGGLAGASFELDDAFTAYDAATIAEMGFDGGKMLTRIALDDAGTLRTLEASARAITELAGAGLIAMVEPFMSESVDGRVRNDLSPDAVIRSIAIASALGATARHMWLKLPVVADMMRVMAATTLPVLLLGGDPSGPAEETYASWRGALRLPGAHGLVVGRALLYPPDDDVAGAVDVAAEMVHSTETV